jgi:hypothetical protein
MQIMTSEFNISKRHKTEINDIINIIENYTKNDDINILLKAYENLHNYIKDKDINEISIDICNSYLKAVIDTIDNIKNKKVDSRAVIILGCNILRMLSKHKNINNSEVMSKFINCIYNLIHNNNKNKEVLKYTLEILLNFDTIIDHNYISICRIQIINNVIKKNTEDKTIVLNSCLVIKKNYNIKKNKEYTYYCLETLISILKVYPNDEEIQESLCNVIIEIISFKTSFDHNIIMKNNGIDIFITNIKKYKNNLNIVKYSCQLLIFLLTIPTDHGKYGSKKIVNFENIITEIIKLDCIEFLSDICDISKNSLLMSILLLIRKLCLSKENYIRIINAGYINKILQTIEKYKKNENIVFECLCILKCIYLYDIIETKEQLNYIILQSSDINIILSVMKMYINNVKILIKSFQIIYRYNNLPISYNETLSNNFLELSLLKDIKFRNYRFETIYNKSQIFIDIGGIDVIFEIIEKNKNNVNILIHFYNLLFHYIYSNGKIAINEIVNKGGIKIITESLKTHIKNKNLRLYTLLLLGFFCINPDTPYLTHSNKEYQIIVFKSGCIQLAMESLQIETNNNECRELNAAIALIAAITIENKDNVINIIEYGGLNVILGAIKAVNNKNVLLTQKVLLAHRACYLIANILIANISDHGTMKFAMENGIELVIHMMKEFIKDRGLCNPLKVLYYVSKNEELLMSIATILGMVGGFNFLIEFIHIRSEDKYNENVHEYASEILNNLTKDNSILKKMRNDKVLEQVLEMTNTEKMTDEIRNKYSEFINKLKTK